MLCHVTRCEASIKLLYGFSFFDPFMIVIPWFLPYLATNGISMRQFMELQAVFALVIVCGELPSGLLSDLRGRKKTLLLGSTLKAVSFSLLPLWSSYAGFLFYTLTMGIALSMISGGDVALLYDWHLAAGGERSRGTAVLGNGLDFSPISRNHAVSRVTAWWPHRDLLPKAASRNN